MGRVYNNYYPGFATHGYSFWKLFGLINTYLDGALILFIFLSGKKVNKEKRRNIETQRNNKQAFIQ